MLAAIAERTEQYLAQLVKDEAEGHYDPHEDMTELTLDARPIRVITEQDAVELARFKNLSKLTLNQTGLHSFKNMPVMPQVKTLEATDNHISGDIQDICAAFPNLRKLQLGANHIKTLKDLEPLASLNQLEHLGLDMNPVSSSPDYRAGVFALLPSLTLLDSVDREGTEKDVEDSDDEEEEIDDDNLDEPDTTLKQFYEADLPDEDDEEDDFEPDNENEEDEEIDEDDDEDDDNVDGEEEGNGDEEGMEGHAKRKADQCSLASQDSNKVAKTD